MIKKKQIKPVTRIKNSDLHCGISAAYKKKNEKFIV